MWESHNSQPEIMFYCLYCKRGKSHYQFPCYSFLQSQTTTITKFVRKYRKKLITTNSLGTIVQRDENLQSSLIAYTMYYNFCDFAIEIVAFIHIVI